MFKEGEYYTYIHTDTSLTTLGSVVSDPASPLYGIDIKTLLGWENESINNADSLKQSILEDEKVGETDTFVDKIDSYQSQSDSQLKKIPLPIGTQLIIPFSAIDRSFGVILSTNQIVPTKSFKSFFAKQLVGLYNDPEYKVDKVSLSSLQNIVQKQYAVTVWVWSKASSTSKLFTTDKMEKYEDKILNLTPYISQIRADQTENGGNFNITLESPVGEFDGEVWTFGTEKVSNDISNLISLRTTKQPLLFELLLQENDIVFIRFEKLVRDEVNEVTTFIDKRQLQGQVYDMIGLIDNVKVQGGWDSNTISISGRDLMKLLIDDQVHFYPMEYVPGGIFANATGAVKEKLNRFNGQIISRFQYAHKTIESTLKYIFNALSTISICSNTLFESYGNRRTQVYPVSEDELERQKQASNKVEKLKQKVLLHIRNARLSDGVYTDSISDTQVYSKLFNFLNTIYRLGVYKEGIGGVLEGWSEFLYNNGEDIGINEVTFVLHDVLFKKKRGWRDSKGRPVTDGERQQLIKDIEKYAKEISSLNVGTKDKEALQSNFSSIDTEQVSKTANNIREKDDNYSKKLLESDKTGSDIAKYGDGLSDNPTPQDYQQITSKYLLDYEELRKSELKEAQKFAVQDQVDETLKKSVSPVIYHVIKGDRIGELKVLQDRYEALKFKLGSIKLWALPVTLQDLASSNKDAYKAILKTWEVVKELNKPAPPPLRKADFVNGIWQIIKLVIDPSASNRRITDASIGNEHGSLLRAVRKICQTELVEFFGDTYGDQYYFVVRKPPFDRESIVNIIDGVVVDEDSEKTVNTIIDIHEKDLISVDLGYDNRKYAWYYLQYQSFNIAFAYLKAVFFPELSELWGSNAKQLVSSYTPYFPVVDSEDQKRIGFFLRQAIEDYQYLIQSNCYLPFTRTGTIVVERNRLIKRGNFIRLKYTGEIFYVKGVSNSLRFSSNGSVDGATVLTVERGMREEYIRGKKVPDIGTVSYFDIIETPVDPSITNQNSVSIEQFNKVVLSNWKVNTDILDFFLKRKQWA